MYRSHIYPYGAYTCKEGDLASTPRRTVTGSVGLIRLLANAAAPIIGDTTASITFRLCVCVCVCVCVPLSLAAPLPASASASLSLSRARARALSLSGAATPRKPGGLTAVHLFNDSVDGFSAFRVRRRYIHLNNTCTHTHTQYTHLHTQTHTHTQTQHTHVGTYITCMHAWCRRNHNQDTQTNTLTHSHDFPCTHAMKNSKT